MTSTVILPSYRMGLRGLMEDTMPLLRILPTASLLIAAMPPAIAQTAQSQPLEGKFRGGYVCAKLPTTRGVLSTPLDIVIRDGKVQFARPLFNIEGTVVVGTELATGNIDAEGRLHLISAWTYLGNKAHGDYSGVLTPHGGTLTGSQIWSAPDGTDQLTRPCGAALVPVPDTATP